MAFVPIQYLAARTTAYISAGATAFTTDSTTTALLLAQLGASGNYTTVSFSDGVNSEIMFITGVSGGAVNVTRAQEGTTAVPLASGATFRFVWTETSILAIAPGGTVTCTGDGGTNVTGGPDYTISSPLWTFTPGPGIGISGGPYHFTISSSVPSGPVGPPGPDGPAVVVLATGLATVDGGPDTYTIDVAAPAFVAGTGISITGDWPNITIENTQTQGGTGTVTGLVGGDGITISGDDPTILPTVSLTPVGPGADTYGGITLNDYGQITALASGFCQSISTSTSGVVIATPSSGEYTVDVDSATHSQQGLVALAPATNAGSNDSANDTQAVTPKGVNAVVAALAVTPASFSVAGTQTALSSGSYTTTISGFNIPVTVVTGKSATVDVYVEVYDPSNLTTAQSFAFGLFNGATLLAGNTVLVGCVRQLRYLINAAFNSTISVKTTTLTGTAVVANYYAVVTNN